MPTNKMKPYIPNIFFGFILVVASYAFIVWYEPTQKDIKAPNFKLPLLVDSTGTVVAGPLPFHESNNYSGKITVVNFWASWCKACDKENLQLQELGRLTQNNEMNMIGIVSFDRKEEAQASSKLAFRKYAHVWDKDGTVTSAFRVHGLPQTLVLSRTKRIIYRHPGPLEPEHLLEIEKILKQENLSH